ncbi:MAG: hypothetical protein PWP31_154 [Clostridia bacterium]|nr:hypothetical protein [Clostridia bacterium]
MTNNSFYYVVFPSTHHGLRLEKILRDKEIPFTIVPTPRQISASCGIAICVTEGLKEQVRIVIKENEVKIEGIYRL